METLQKNQTVRAVIEGYSSEGLGIARVNGQVVFVHRAVRGEECDILIMKVLKHAAFGKVTAICTPSGHRQEPDCPYYGKCGGCDFRHMDYAEELAAKRQRVQDALTRLGGSTPGVAAGFSQIHIGQRQEDRHDQRGDQLQVIGIQTDLQHDLQHDIVDDGADGNGQQLQSDIAEQLAEDDLADDHGSQADYDSAAAHVDVTGSLILCQQGTGERHQTVGDHQAKHDVGIGVDPLRPRHMGVSACGTDGTALFRAEEPVEHSHDHGGQHDQQRQGIVQRQCTHIALAQQKIIFIYTDRLIGFAAHDPQVDGIQRQLGQDTGQNSGDSAAGVKNTGDEAGQHTSRHGAQHGQPRVNARADHHDAHGAAGGQRSVHRQVGHVQNPECDIDADRHNAPTQPLGNRSGQCIHQRGKETHRSCSFNSKSGEDAEHSASSREKAVIDQSSMAV